MFMSVLLPAPEKPMTATMRPRSTCVVMPSRAVTRLLPRVNVLPTSWKATAGGVVLAGAAAFVSVGEGPVTSIPSP